VKPKLLAYFAPALLAATFLIAADQSQLKLPDGYVIPPSSVSPNREYGVSAFDRFLFARAKSLRRNTLWQKKRIKATALRFPTGLR